MAGANGNFAFSKAGIPCFNSCDAYMDDLLCKGKIPEIELKPSAPLAESLVSGQMNLLKEIRGDLEIKLQMTSDLDFPDQLLLACAAGKLDMLQGILTSSVDLDAFLPTTHHEGLTPLSVASIANQPSVCTQLIKLGAQVDKVNIGGVSALHWAVLAENLNTVKVMLGNGARLDVMDSKGLAPVHYGCILGLSSCVAFLIKECPSVVESLLSPGDVNPLMLACLCGHHQLAELLLKHGTGLALRGDGRGMSAVHYATWSGSVKCVKTVSSHTSWRQAVAQRDMWGRTPLITAAAKGDPVMCQCLLKKGALLSEVDSEGRGVLHWAAISGQVSCVEFVLHCKGGVALCSLRDTAGACALHYAAIQRDVAVLAAILKQDTRSAGLTTHRGATALSWAALCGQLEGVQALLKGEGEGGDDPVPGVVGGALHGAACVGAVEICRALLAAGAMVNEVSGGSIPLHHASRFGHTECVKCLLSHAAAVNSISNEHKSSLHLAVMYGHGGTARELLEHGAHRDQPLPPTGSWPVHLACSHGHTETLQAIISAGGSVNQPRESDDHTPLHIAASLGHLDCCKVLIQHGAHTGTRIKSSIEGLTALDVAMANRHSGCTSYLMACHTPSGGGVYHRAAITIQAVWRYYRYKCRRAITRYWSAVVLQRCVRKWLCGVKAIRVRQARLAARHRAASTIQLHWREYIREKRRYEATYARLKAQLRQEQLAASLIIAELQCQTQSVSLPVAVPTGQHKARKSHHLLKLSSHLRAMFPGDARTVPSRPRRPLPTHTPTIKLQPHTASKPTTSSVHLPPVSCHHSSTPVGPPQPSIPTTSSTPLPTLHPVAPTSTSGSRNKPTRRVDKLPPIPAVNSVTVKQSTQAKDVEPYPHPRVDLEPRPYPMTTLTPPTTPVSGKDEDAILPASPPPFRIPSRSQYKLTRRCSTFKATPLGYRAYLPRDRKNSEQVAFEEDLSDFRLESSTSGQVSAKAEGINLDASKLSFAEGLNLDVSIASSEGGVPEGRIQSGNMTDTGVHVAEDQNEKTLANNLAVEGEEQKRLLNQVERFERLMKVLTLLKGTANMAEFATGGGEGEGGGGGVGTVEELKDYIKLALDEAVQLRVESADITMENTTAQSDPVSSYN